MNISFENLKKFFDKIKSVGFFERIFFWKNVSSLSYDAYEEFKTLSAEVDGLRENIKQIDNLKDNINKIDKELSIAKNTIDQNNKTLQQKESEAGRLEEAKLKNEEKILELNKEISSYKGTIEQNNKSLRANESEIGRLEEANKKNQEKIFELNKEITILKRNNRRE